MKPEKIDYRRVFINVTAISLAFIYSSIWFHMITTPEQYMGSDFIGIFAVGRTAQNEGPSQAYDLSVQQKYQSQLFGFEIPPQEVFLFAHPPFIIPFAQLTATNNFVYSLIFWNLLMAVFFVASTIPLLKLVKEFILPSQDWLALLLGILLFFPSFESIYIGQDSGLTYFGICLWMLGILTGKDWLAGLGLSLSAVRPHITLLLAAPFIFKKRNVWWWFMIGAAGLGLFSLAYAGINGVEGFLRILPVSGSGEGYQLSESSMVNFIGLALRAFPFVSANTIHWIGWLVYAVTLISLCVFWARSETIKETQIGVAVIASVFAAPHLHYHDLSILMIPLLALILIIIRNKYWDAKNAVLLPLGISAFLLFTSYSEILYLNVHYLVELFLFLGLLFPEKLKFVRQKQTVQN